MKLRTIILACAGALLLAAAAPTHAQKKKTKSVLDVTQSITDDAIIFPESFETDTQALLEGWYMKNYTATDDRYKTAPDAVVSDEVLIQRLKNIPAVIDMPFNQVVRKYIERYTKHGRSLVTTCLGLGNYYLPIIDQALEAEGLPLELRYLPMIESTFNPNAVSRAGATGLWQFMLSAAKGYDMEVNSLVDERRDPYESSKKGARLLKDLYNTFGKWDLAIAAYNCGPGNVSKAIRRAGGDPSKHDFWSIYNYLPAQTRGYVPMFIAANYIMNYYQDHNISPVVPTKPLVTDTVAVNSRVNLNQIAKVLDIPIDELRLLNPQFRTDVIPGNSQKQYMLILPSKQIHAYIMSEDAIKGYNAADYAQRIVADPGSLAKESELSIEEDTTPDSFITAADELVAEESTENTATDADYRLVRENSQKKEDARRQQRERSNTAAASGNQQIEHKVAAGETLESIAEMYHVSTANLKIWNNLKRDSVRTGQKLIVKGAADSRSRNNEVVADNSNADFTPATPAAPARKSNSGTASRSRSQRAQASQATAAKQEAAKESKPKQQKASQKKNKAAEAQEAPAKTSNKSKSSKTSRKQDKQEQPAKTDKKGKNSKADKNAKSGNADKKGKNSKHTAKESKPASHEVKSGESLERIAKKNGVSVDELRKANKHIKNDKLKPGDKLTVPSKSKKGDSGKKASGKKTDSKKTDSKKTDSSKKTSGKKADSGKQASTKKADSGKSNNKAGKKKKK